MPLDLAAAQPVVEREGLIEAPPTVMRASGVLLRDPEGRVLLLRRSSKAGDFGGYWDLPGGRLDDDETLADAAIRECFEETGIMLDSAGQLLMRRVVDGVDYTTFVKDVKEPVAPVLNDEHNAYAWLTPSEVAGSLIPHPGVEIALQRLGSDELGIARLMASADLTSPQRYENVTLFDIRITGTGVSYRVALDEFVFRDPALYCNSEFLARCNGLPVIWEHPKKNMLDSKEFADRIVGTVFLPYIKGDEVWAIAKIYDDEAIKLMQDDQLSTSPAVVFRDVSVNSKYKNDDGSTLLVEGKPSLLDHIAFCPQGVWDKGEEPKGIRVDSQQTPIDVVAFSPWTARDVVSKLDEAVKRSRVIALGNLSSRLIRR